MNSMAIGGYSLPVFSAYLCLLCVSLRETLIVEHGIAALSPAGELTVRDGAIIRGPLAERRIALVFTGHEFAEGGQTILDELARHHARATFFLTGDFLANAHFRPLVRRIVAEGHGLGPHSDKHLLANRQRIASSFPPDHRSANVVPNRQRIAQIVTLRTATASLSFVRDLSP